MHRRLQEKVEAGLLKQGGRCRGKASKNHGGIESQDRMPTTKMWPGSWTKMNRLARKSHGNGNGNHRKRHDNPGVECTPGNAITEAQKSNTGIAMVKVGGNLFSGTEITGPHSSLGRSGGSQAAVRC
jgi:hypothetical protein